MKLFTKIAAGAVLGFTALSASAGTLDINVDGIFSYDLQGDTINTVLLIQLDAPATITGIGWDVTLFADSPSWLSEMSVSFGPVGGPAGLFLTPGAGDSSSGTMSYSSGGLLDLSDNGITDIFLADGLLQLEFFETLDDYIDDWDGIWEGTITIECEGDCEAAVPMPEPGILVLLGLGLVGVVAARRRS